MKDSTKGGILLAALLAAALAGVGYALAQHAEAGRLARDLAQTKEAHQAALNEAAKAQEARAQAAALQGQLDALDAQRRQQAQRIGELEADLARHPVPPRPGPPPADTGGILVGLQGMGVHPRLAGGALAFPVPEGGTLWTWGQEAQRVPALEGRLTASDALAQGLRTSLDTTTAELSTSRRQDAALGQEAAHYKGAFEDEQRARQAAESAAARAERLRAMAALPWAAGGSWNPADGTYGAWLDRDLSIFRLGAEVNQVRAAVTAGGGVTYEARIRVGIRF